MAEESGKREFFDEERSGRGAVATAENVEEGETASDGSHSRLTQESSNDSNCVSLEMGDSSGASDVECCDFIKGCRLRARHSEHRVAYYRNFRSNRSRPTLSESANPTEIINATFAIAEAAQIAAERTNDIVDDINDTTKVLRSRSSLMRATANWMLRQRDRDNYRVIASDYVLDVFAAQRAGEDAQSAYEAAFDTVDAARNAVQQLSEAINMGSTETRALEEAAIAAFASTDEATILCYQKQYLALQALKKCKQDLIIPVFPRCECQRCDIRSSPEILFMPICSICGSLFIVWAWFEFTGFVFYGMFGFGLFLIGVTIGYALYKVGRCFWKMQARRIRKGELESDIKDIKATLRWLKRHYINNEG